MVGLSRELRDLRVALFFFILVDFPSREIGKIKKDSGLCGVRPACAAGPRRATGPDPFSPTHFSRARRENKDSDLRALGGMGASLFLNLMRSSLIVQFLSNRREHILRHRKILSASMLINRDR